MTRTADSTPAPPATSDGISQALSLAIHEHRIAPGTRLGEDELSEIYGVSRTVVRAALQTLSHIKLVDIRRNKGASVASPSITEAHEVFEARELLEPRTARSAAKHATSADITMLERHINDEHAALDANDPGRALYLSGLFHTEIARIAGQATITGFIETLIARSSLIIALYWRRESALCEKHAHYALLQALADHNEQQAEELMRSHLVDLHSALDLRERNAHTLSLKDALSP
ncbi:GntR family transcriptional regulator [Litoreibacter ponti]|uniref:GntR family transcriptional regulator n=1 Tax=Litoreibacter ponti TaxID=1510457 RepID=A0A2T6BCM9_9RHOB|nr:GntR family transcriptional regulator [Litoreibacter ponti]PTX53792.1 GntR family transcriptional regulator [Litoreibacter ponti]